jgi:CRISPR/Cas system-associated exonuclease Cas4 (RecB family)
MKFQEMIPISSIQQFGFCEYSVFLREIKNIETEPTEEMKTGKRVHEQLYEEFLVDAKPSSIDQMIKKSRKSELLSRELFVESETFGIMGRIDEIRFSPNNFVIIDDKPGTTVYTSNKNQVYAYCLAFIDYTSQWKTKEDSRPIIAALRERDSQKIIWKSLFNDTAKNNIISEINRLHSMVEGKLPFLPTTNSNKCRNCSMRERCDKNRF